MSGIQLQGDWEKLAGSFRKMAAFSFMGTHEEIGEMLVSSAQQRFNQERGPDGHPWPKSIRAEDEGGQTMTDTARLKNSITYKAKPEGVAYGTNVKYAAIHQYGGTIRAKGKKLKFRIGKRWAQKASVTIPPRPFLGISKDDQEEIEAIVKDHLEEALK